tara:strand:- start:1002 stop:1709 length:708 start_codon:yes stop_codon:yes gene_type:complete
MSTLEVNKLAPLADNGTVTLGDSGDTITIPTGAGLTVTDEVKTNKISPATGTAFTLGDSGDTFTIPSGATITNSGTATGFGGGKIGQVVSTHTNATSFSTSSSTLVDVTGMSVAITPSATSSKILIMASVTATSNESTRCFIGLKRGSTAIANCSPSGSQIAGVNTGHEQEGNNALFNYHISFLDSPSSVSEQTYKITGCAEGSDVFRLNRSPGDADSNTVSRGASSITVMEVLA